jgi:phospholipid-binding lipoprotein MlaA
MNIACRLVAGAVVVGLLAGCASRGATERDPADRDPLEPVNRAIFRFNDVADRYVARPAAKAYRKATPGALRAGISNLFGNLRYPVTIVNDFLQGKWRQGGADFARFALNTTIGLGGLFDPAQAVGLTEHDEDFGQTLVAWGVPEGPFLMVPILGPYTLTSGVGELAGTPLRLITYLPESEQVVGAWTLDLLQRRAALLGTDEQVRETFDPYLFVRDAYLQNRQFKIYDGDPPEDQWLPEDEAEPAAD